jgi:hypothetical protein
MITGTAPELDIRIHDLVDPKKCYDFLRLKRWTHGVGCLKCTSNRVKKNGHKCSDPLCQRYKCNNSEFAWMIQPLHYIAVKQKNRVSGSTEMAMAPLFVNAK